MAPFAQRTIPIIALGALLLTTSGSVAQLSNRSSLNQGGRDQLGDRYNNAKRGVSIDEWVRRLGEDDPATRLDAVKSLGESGEPAANHFLMQAVGDTDPRVRAKAVDYLGRARATNATLFLIQRLFVRGTEDALRHRVLMALGKIGDSRASRPILEFLGRDLEPDIRGTAIYTLGEVGDSSIEQDLRELAESEEHPRLKRLITDALAKVSARQTAMKDQTAFPTAIDAALQPEPQQP